MTRAPRNFFITFSVTLAEARDLARVAKTLAYPNPEPLAVEMFRIGLREMETRFEPSRIARTTAGQKKTTNSRATRAARPSRRRAR